MNFRVGSQNYILTIGRFEDGTPGEIFINTNMKAGSEADINAVDGAFALSLAIQYGCPLEVLAHGVKRNEDGSPQGVLGGALDAIIAAQK